MKPVLWITRFSILWSGALAVSAAAGLLVLAVNPAFAQPKPVKAPKLPANLVIYRGDSLQTSGLSLASWGSGTVEEDTTKIYSGTESLRVTTHGMYQGASLTFTKPVNLAPFLANKNNYFTVSLLQPTVNPSGGGFEGGFPGYPGGKGGYGSGSSPGFGGTSGGNPGSPGTSGGYPGQYGRAGGGQIQTQKNRQLENLRMVMVTTGGKTLEVMLPLANSASDENQWKNLAIPVAVIPSLTSDDAQIKEIRLFGDAPATLNVGSIGIVEDPTPITVDPINDKTVQRLSKYQYVVNANAGITPLVYFWDWDASDGIQDETEGRNVTHVFRKASVDDSGKSTDFVVTVTVTDPYHLKAPAKATFKVHVTP
jgi:hypothetical protein